MTGLNIFLILLSAITVASVVVALRTSVFIEDEKERTHQAVDFLLGIIAGYIFASPIGGIMMGLAKESGGIILAVHSRLFTQDRMLTVMRTFTFWIIGGFIGSESLEPFRQSFLLLLGS